MKNKNLFSFYSHFATGLFSLSLVVVILFVLFPFYFATVLRPILNIPQRPLSLFIGGGGWW